MQDARRQRFFSPTFSCSLFFELTPFDPRQNAINRFMEHLGSRQQAQNEKSFAWEIEEVSGMREHIVLFQQRERPFLFSELSRQLQRRVPPTFHAQQTKRRLCSRIPQPIQIALSAIQNLILY